MQLFPVPPFFQCMHGMETWSPSQHLFAKRERNPRDTIYICTLPQVKHTVSEITHSMLCTQFHLIIIIVMMKRKDNSNV